MNETEAHLAEDRQRLDKWIWFARVLKTRSLAAKLVSEGWVRVNGAREMDPAKKLRRGDVLTIGLSQGVRVLRVVSLGSRRGPYEEARQLFEDLSDGASDADVQRKS